MDILGINEFTHDVGISYIANGEPHSIVSLEEERFSRKKHHYGFDRAGSLPMLGLEQLVKKTNKHENGMTYIFGSWKTNLPTWFYTKFKILQCYRSAGVIHTSTNNNYFKLLISVIKNYLKRKQALKRFNKIHFLPHHLSHASYAYRTSPFKKALVVILDGSGEKESGSIYLGDGNTLTLKKKYPIDQSLGTLYAIITRMIGFGRDGEGKTMGYAPLGTPIDDIELLAFDNKNDRFDINYSNVRKLNTLVQSDNTDTLRQNIAATLQRDFSKTLLSFFSFITKKYDEKTVCFAGGVALNCAFNGKLLTSGIIDKLYVPAAPNDSGVALGAALEGLSYHQNCYALGLKNAFMGTEPNNDWQPQEANLLSDGFIDAVVHELNEGKVIALCQGRAELGPRALGNRSIIASACDKNITHHLNQNVKNRELWRPYGIIIMEEEVPKLFDVACDMPFMNVALQANDYAKQVIPGCIHIDGSVRIQTVSAENNPLIYRILKKFKEASGVGALINTSFNVAGEPIVNTAQEAIRTFSQTNIDSLYINGEKQQR